MVFQPNTVETPTRVVRLPDPALAHMIRMRGQGYGWEDAAVYLRRQGILISNADIRRFFLGPKARRPRMPAGASRSDPGPISSVEKAAGA